MPVTGDPERAGRAVIRGRKIMERMERMDFGFELNLDVPRVWGVANGNFLPPVEASQEGKLFTSPPQAPPTGKNNA